MRALSGVINSPNSPERYPGSTDCYWVLDLPEGYVIQLTWSSFSLSGSRSCNDDYVEVFDNSSIPGMGGRMGPYVESFELICLYQRLCVCTFFDVLTRLLNNLNLPRSGEKILMFSCSQFCLCFI